MLLAIALSCALLPAPDIMLPGHKPVANEMVVEGELGGYRLVAAPLVGFGWTEVQLGQPFPFSGKYGTHLYAVPAHVPLPERYDRDWCEQQIPATTFPVETASVPLIDPLARILWTYRILGVVDDELRLELVREERFDGEGRPYGRALLQRWLVGLGIAGGLGLLIAVLVRRRRARASAL